MTTLFLKYRPKTFTDLVGQESIVKTLQNAIKNDSPAHAYLFAGSRGTGKTSSARIFAKALNCDEIKSGNPCGGCHTCDDIAQGNLIDIIEIDAASHTGVDNIRSIIEKIDFAPTYAKRKVYIIDEVHMLSKGAFNALLKTLEEPPDHSFFLLATTEMHKIPETIVSRCQTFRFNRFTIPQLVERLQFICEQEGFKADPQALEIIAQKAEGGMRDSITLLDQVAAETENNITPEAVRTSLGLAPKEHLEQMWEALTNKNSDQGIKILHQLNESGSDFRHFGHEFLKFLRTKLHENLNTPEKLSLILPAIEAFEQAVGRLKSSPIAELPLEIAIITLCHHDQIASSAPAPSSPPAPTSVPTASSNPAPTPPPPSDPSPTPSPPEPTPPPEKNKPNDGFVFDDNTSSPSTPSPKKKADQASAPPLPNDGSVIQLSANNVTVNLKNIGEKAGIPIFAKKSLLTTQVEVNGQEVTFKTDSDFHLNKLTANNVAGPINKAINDIFGQEASIKFVRSNTPKPRPQTTTSDSKSNESASIEDFLSF